MAKKETRKENKTQDAVQILDQMIGEDTELRKLVEIETLNSQVARLIYDARTAAGLTQKQLAELIGTAQSVIARLEDSDYEGHSLSMLARIADVLSKRVEVRLVDRKGRRAGPRAA